MPLYEYCCLKCGQTFTVFRKVAEREEAVCDCGGEAGRKWTAPGRPVVYEYYSENLGAVITGPRQKAQIMKERNVREVA